ncbi:HDOD domain-containing protein [Vibrio sp. SCSIO 43136]|uniref:EAL and HDOD domain-containing protein n=1 Tax=Vibrio sp. SCSIO 43136 TaxID=2819101 RepID=UPI0020754383|nr:HDOD domain-containing protein [Vibrio sp. SCSIO 43136]USD64345.1 HDOD domain-containing protein [Vibrio sp. SCSIO 43136]
MKYAYVARQPIFDTEMNTVAYELLFRDGPKNTFPAIEAQLATSRLLVEQFLGAHQKSFGKKRAFVNFPYQSLIDQLPELFPSTSIVVEILEDCEPTDELFEAIKSLYKNGYTIALDDFVPSPEWLRFLPYIAIIKFDIITVPIAKAELFMKKLAKTKIEFLAEKVETYEEYEQAKKAGFTLFQGYFFAKPEIIQRKEIRPSFITTVQLCKEIANDDINFNAVEKIVASDVSLSYKLLRSVNSSAMLRKEITSFKQALVYLGEERLKRFVSMIALASTSEGKPNSLYSASISRARFSELIAKNHPQMEPSSAFLTGIFSLLDSLLDQSLDDILESLPVDQSIKDALLKGEGELGKTIELVKAFEQAKWDKVAQLRAELNIKEDELTDIYDDAIIWSNELLTLK